MNRKTLGSLFVSMLLCFNLSAQQEPCYTDQAVEQLKLKDLQYTIELDQVRNQLLTQLQQQSSNSQRQAVRTISIVVHVVNNTNFNEPSDIAIQSMITIINEDFRRQNADAANTRADFLPVASDAQIEFCLDQIIRKSNNVGCYASGDDNMKVANQGGSATVTPTQFLNIWITDICGGQFSGVAGYAYLPTPGMHGSNIDGVVIDYRLGLGNGNNTTTHEIGHYFGLRHCWGTNQSCNDDDGFNDTPNTSGPNNVCQANNSCNTTSPGDQVENFMDYTSCRNMFTIEQANFMNGILDQVRSSLLNSTGCSNTVPITLDADFSASVTTVVVGNSVDFTDLSTGIPTSWTWAFSSGTPVTSTVQNPSNIVYNTPGLYKVTLNVSNANGTDIETKQNYIQVVNGPASGCDTISNVSAIDTLRLFAVNGGYLSGHNAFGDKSKLDFFTNPTPGKEIFGTLLLFGVAKFANASSFITVNVWDNTGNAGEPGNVLVSQNLLISSIANDVANNNFTSVIFGSPIVLNTDYYVGISFTYASGDTVALVTNSVSTLSPPTAWEQWANNEWYAYSNANSWNINLSHVILPILCPVIVVGAPIADFTANETEFCQGENVTFTDLSTNNPTAYSWSFPGGTPATSTAANPIINYNTPGSYMVELEATNNIASNTITKGGYITVNNNPTGTITTTPTSCSGSNDGSASMNASGGTPAYSYNWSNGVNTASIINVASGAYSVTVTDDNACTVTVSSIIAEAGQTITINKTDLACYGGKNGEINVVATGGLVPYRFTWSNGVSNSSQINIPAGTYAVTVTDNNGCVKSSSIDVLQPDSLAVDIQTTPATTGNSDGTATASISGGIAPYTYLWSNGSTTQSVTGLSAGSHSMTVTDNNGCIRVVSYIISVATSIGTLKDELSFTILPNPNAGIFVVEIDLKFQTDVQLIVYDMLGKSITKFREEEIREKSITMNIADFPNGTYFIKLKTPNYSLVRKMLKSR